jgi:hypothetical protein
MPRSWRCRMQPNDPPPGWMWSVILVTVVFVTTALSLGVGTAGAKAARLATAAEEEGMIRAVETYVHDGDEFSMKVANVSTVDPTWAFGTWEDHQPNFPGQPIMQEVVFQRLVGNDWRIARYPTSFCGIAFEEPIPKAAQIDLRLPSCLPSYSLINAPAFIHDSTDQFKQKPRSIKIESPSVTWFLTGMRWKYWKLNRSGRAQSRAVWTRRTCTPDCEAGKVVHEKVEVTLSDVERCRGRWVYGEANWYSVAKGHETYGPFRFPCHGRTWR